MMLDRRLALIAGDSGKYVRKNILYQWFGMSSGIILVFSIGHLLQSMIGRETGGQKAAFAAAALSSIPLRLFCTERASRMSFLASKSIKMTLRDKIYRKLLRLGISYSEQVPTSEVVQVAVEGVEQLETYFGAYLPQLYYSLLAPLTLFAVLSFVSFKSAAILLACVPLIPVSIAAVQTTAKKLLSRYWDRYTDLGNTFLENLQGLTTLKIYRADACKNEEMNLEAERFRRITMKVLTMQLTSLTIMDLIAFGGTALGLIVSVSEYRAGKIGFMSCFSVIMLSAEYFLPLRALGSYFHVAMNGMAAGDKILRLLDLSEPERKTGVVPKENWDIRCENLCFAYEEGREILSGVNMRFPQGSLTSIVGESGSGKSTIASILTGLRKGYAGSVTIGGIELRELSEESITESITKIDHGSYLFKGTVRDNLLLGDPDAGDDNLWEALSMVSMADYLRSLRGLDTPLQENAANLSGGQRQRLALARALLHDSPLYIFDEATSNIDAESEQAIQDLIHRLSGRKTVIVISHRLANAVRSDNIYVMAGGRVAERGTHAELIRNHGEYGRLWGTQQTLERYAKEAVTA